MPTADLLSFTRVKPFTESHTNRVIRHILLRAWHFVHPVNVSAIQLCCCITFVKLYSTAGIQFILSNRLPGGCTILHSNLQGMRVPVILHSHQYLVLLVCSVLTVSLAVWCCQITVALVCIPEWLRSEHLVVHLFAIHKSSPVTHRSKNVHTF